ncbi:MAG: RIP metalloprotease RseP [Pseudomonadota bacterium]
MDLIGLIPSFGNVIFTIAVFIIALSVIVAIHEYGHYIVGRWSGIHADVFSIGFGPVLYARTDKRGTQWQVAALPLGGYVKFKGDANAASAPDGAAIEGMSDAETRQTMQGAPLWARSATVAAGPIFNFILSIIVFTGLVFYSGLPGDPMRVGDINPVPFGETSLQPGDQILDIAGEPAPTTLEEFAPWSLALPNERTLPYVVLRDGQELTFEAPHPAPALVGEVLPQSAAIDNRLEEGDVILAIDGDEIATFEELRGIVGASEGREMRLSIWRSGETLEVSFAPRQIDQPLADGSFETRWLLGIAQARLFEDERRSAGIGEAVSIAAASTYSIVQNSLSTLYHMAAGAISSCNLSGPVRIAETSGQIASQGLDRFIQFIAVLSTAIGLINLFPIPVLDGGHLVFHAWEAVSGKPPSDRALRVLMTAGLTVVLAFMSLALANDLFLCP